MSASSFFAQLSGGSAKCGRECCRVLSVVSTAYSTNLLEVLPCPPGSIVANWTAIDKGALSQQLKNKTKQKKYNEI